MNGYDSVLLNTTVVSMVRGEGIALEIPVTKLRLNQRARKQIFCWLYSTTHWAT